MTLPMHFGDFETMTVAIPILMILPLKNFILRAEYSIKFFKIQLLTFPPTLFIVSHKGAL
jgi:hypothetical protein